MKNKKIIRLIIVAVVLTLTCAAFVNKSWSSIKSSKIIEIND
ncbi:hypothetical protein [Clostridium hydrogeniformans]|nr:hypothetical protein [Clostridium hydrogeniformans]